MIDLKRAWILLIQIFRPRQSLRTGPVELPITHTDVFVNKMRFIPQIVVCASYAASQNRSEVVF